MSRPVLLDYRCLIGDCESGLAFKRPTGEAIQSRRDVGAARQDREAIVMFGHCSVSRLRFSPRRSVRLLAMLASPRIVIFLIG